MAASNKEKRRTNFENIVEDAEKQYGIVNLDDDATARDPKTEIIVDEYGRFWRYNDRGTMKWRVKIDGSDYRNSYAEEMKHQKQQFDAAIAKVQDKELKELLEEEALYNDVGGTAVQWEELERKKKAYEDRKKKQKEIS